MLRTLLLLALFFCLCMPVLGEKIDPELCEAVIGGKVGKVLSRVEEDPAILNARYGRYKWSLIFYAARANKPRMIRRLSEKGFSVNAADTGRWTPLHVATHAKNYEAVLMLLNLGATPCLSSEFSSPVSLAVDVGASNLQRLFTRRGLAYKPLFPCG